MKLEYHYNDRVWMIIWDPNKAIEIGECPIWGGGWLERSFSVCIYIYSKTSLNRPTMEPTLNGPFREVVGLGS